jgi:hypothetical protein
MRCASILLLATKDYNQPCRSRKERASSRSRRARRGDEAQAQRRCGHTVWQRPPAARILLARTFCRTWPRRTPRRSRLCSLPAHGLRRMFEAPPCSDRDVRAVRLSTDGAGAHVVYSTTTRVGSRPSHSSRLFASALTKRFHCLSVPSRGIVLLHPPIEPLEVESLKAGDTPQPRGLPLHSRTEPLRLLHRSPQFEDGRRKLVAERPTHPRCSRKRSRQMIVQPTQGSSM